MKRSKELVQLLKKGNRSAGIAALVNTGLTLIKVVGFLVTGNVALFAEAMHTGADTLNQAVVYVGSALSKKKPTERFPDGFGRLINIVCALAVIIIGFMSIKTIIEGVHVMMDPSHDDSFRNFLVGAGILLVGGILELFVLRSAIFEALKEVGETKLTALIRSLKKVKPATKLVLIEDAIATAGNIIALIAICLAYFGGLHAAEGFVGIPIGLAMLYAAIHMFMDNAAGLLGESDNEFELHIGELLMSDTDVKDIKELRVFKEGELLHVEVKIEIDSTLTIKESDEIRGRLETLVIEHEHVSQVMIEFVGYDGIDHWSMLKEKKTSS